MPTVLLIALGLLLQSCRPEPSSGIGDALVDDYVEAITASCAVEASGRKMRAVLDELDERIQDQHSGVPEEFFTRYRRLVDATRLVIDLDTNQSNRETIQDYIRSITGTAPVDADLIASAAEAFMLEVSRLRALLRKSG